MQTMTQAYNASEYEDMIDAILSVADLDKISVKRIRNAVQELFNVDLLPHKEELNDVILKRYYKLAEERENSKSRSADTEELDHLMALQLQKEEGKRRPTRGGAPAPTKVAKAAAKVVKRKEKTTSGKGPNNAFNADLVLSPQLEDVLECSRMSRPQVVKQMWVYIRNHGLQNPSDGRQIDCDAKLRAVFKKRSVSMFEMNKLLSKHLYKEDE